jgi:DNA-binding protein HU-beta
MADVKKQSKKVNSKADIIGLVANSITDLSKAAVAEVIDTAIDCIKQLIATDNKVTIIGFGTFEQGERKARTGRNPQTGQEIKIAASKSIRFRAGKDFKDLLNNKKK